MYCGQLRRLALRLRASLVCADYGRNGHTGKGTRALRREDWGDPTYLATAARLPDRLRADGVKISELILVGVSYSGFANAELVATHPEMHPSALIIVDSYLDLSARFKALPPHHITREEIRGALGARRPPVQPSTRRDRRAAISTGWPPPSGAECASSSSGAWPRRNDGSFVARPARSARTQCGSRDLRQSSGRPSTGTSRAFITLTRSGIAERVSLRSPASDTQSSLSRQSISSSIHGRHHRGGATVGRSPNGTLPQLGPRDPGAPGAPSAPIRNVG